MARAGLAEELSCYRVTVVGFDPSNNTLGLLGPRVLLQGYP